MTEKVNSDIKLYIKEEIDKAKDKSLRIFSIIAALITILTGFGIYGLATSYADKLMEGSIFEDMENKAEQSVNKIDSYAIQAKNDANAILEMRSRYEPDLNSITHLKESLKFLTKELKQKGISRFQWSSGGDVDNMECIQIIENSEESYWKDNHLCFER